MRTPLGVTRREGLSLADTIEGGQGTRVPRRTGRYAVAMVTAEAAYSTVAEAPAAFAAVRTAPATAPATLSLKTLGMM